MKKIHWLLLALGALPLNGCFSADTTTGNKIMPTLGRQLTDLQAAEKSGAITSAQYEAQKAELLKNSQ